MSVTIHDLRAVRRQNGGGGGGSQDLASVLGFGNLTNGIDIDHNHATGKTRQIGTGTINEWLANSGRELGIATKGGFGDTSYLSGDSAWQRLFGASHSTNPGQHHIGAGDNYMWIDSSPASGLGDVLMILGNSVPFIVSNSGGFFQTTNVNVSPGGMIGARNAILNIGVNNSFHGGGQANAINSPASNSACIGGLRNVITHSRVAVLGGSDLVNSSQYTSDYALMERAEVQNGDVRFVQNTSGVVLKDRTLGTFHRLVLNNGVISVEAE